MDIYHNNIVDYNYIFSKDKEKGEKYIYYIPSNKNGFLVYQATKFH